MFREKYKAEFNAYNPDIADANFPRSTWILRPGNCVWLTAYVQGMDSCWTTKAAAHEFLQKHSSMTLGAHGAILAWLYFKDRLPRGYRYYSFDKDEALLKDKRGYPRIPCIDVFMDGKFNFGMDTEIDPQVNHPSPLPFSVLQFSATPPVGAKK